MATYVHGNVVRKGAAVEQVNQRVRKNRSKAMHMSKGYVTFLAAAAFIVVFACMQYLQLQSNITSCSQEITALQQELADVKEANTTRYNAIMNAMNLEEIREIAINEFGMVYADTNQIIRYQRPDASKVIQYASIPESGILASSDEVK